MSHAVERAIQSTVGMRFEWGAFWGRSELEVPTRDLLFHFCLSFHVSKGTAWAGEQRVSQNARGLSESVQDPQVLSVLMVILIWAREQRQEGDFLKHRLYFLRAVLGSHKVQRHPTYPQPHVRGLPSVNTRDQRGTRVPMGAAASARAVLTHAHGRHEDSPLVRHVPRVWTNT